MSFGLSSAGSTTLLEVRAWNRTQPCVKKNEAPPTCKPDFVLPALHNTHSLYHLSGSGLTAGVCSAYPPQPPHRSAVNGRATRLCIRRAEACLAKLRFTWHFNPQGLPSPALLPGGVVSYTAISPLPRRSEAVSFLWHFPASPGCPWRIPPVRWCGALRCPDFPQPRHCAAAIERLAALRRQNYWFGGKVSCRMQVVGKIIAHIDVYQRMVNEKRAFSFQKNKVI